MARAQRKLQEQLFLPDLLPQPIEATPEPAPEPALVADNLRRKAPAARRAKPKIVRLAENTSETTATAQEAPPAAAPTLAAPDAIAPPRVAEAAPASPPALRTGAYLAALLASLVAIAVLAFGAQQFAETQRAQRASLALHDEALHREFDARQVEVNAKAVELLMKYNELMLQPTAAPARGSKRETRYWRDSLALGLLESLANLTHGQADWENTVLWALERHSRFVREQRISCANYSPSFINLLERAANVRAQAFCRDPAAG